MEGDWTTGIFWLVVVVVSFLQWLGKKFQERKIQKEWENRPRDEEKELNPETEALYRGELVENRPQTRGEPSTEDPLADLFDALGVPQPTKAPPPPPPVLQKQPGPDSPSAPPPLPETVPAEERLSKKEREALERVRARELPSRRTRSSFSAIGQAIQSPARLREAIAIKEVIDLPVSLRREHPLQTPSN
ncbi:MAG: hypothetical protein AAF555_10835 [Verrucomicrobiota bacterium]